MKNTLFIIFLFIYMAPSFAQTNMCTPDVNRPGIFSNVSSTGMASKESPIIACTIINAYESIDSATVFFAESTTGDAQLEIFYTEKPYDLGICVGCVYEFTAGFSPVYADNYMDYLRGGVRLDVVKNKLRLPNRLSDAAFVMTSDQTYYNILKYASKGTKTELNHSFGVCAKGYPKSGVHDINVSITNLGPSRNNVCYEKRYFCPHEADRLSPNCR